MMPRLTTTAVSEIKAAQGIYRASDVANAYGCHRSTVVRIWQGRIHTDLSPAPDFPEITARPRREDLADTIDVLTRRGMSVKEIAEELGLSERTTYLFKGVFAR